MKCTKPDCDCMEQAELSHGGPVKDYPCFAQQRGIYELKSPAQPNPQTAGEVPAISPGGGAEEWINKTPMFLPKTMDDLIRFQKQAYEAGAATLRQPAGTVYVEGLLKRYKKYISNIEWHIKANQPFGEELARSNEQLEIYNEFIKDLEQLQLKRVGWEDEFGDLYESIQRIEDKGLLTEINKGMADMHRTIRSHLNMLEETISYAARQPSGTVSDAVAFASWTYKNDWFYSSRVSGYPWRNRKTGDVSTTQQLYQTFLSQPGK